MLILLASCETIIDIDLPAEDENLVVNSKFTGSEPISFELTESMDPLNDEQLRRIEDAEVSLFEGDQQIETLTHSDMDQPGIYHGNEPLEHGRNYRVEIDVDGYDEVTAESWVPENTPQITDADFTAYARDAFDQDWHRVEMSFPIDPGEDTYYTVSAAQKVIIEDTGDTLYYARDMVTSDSLFNHAGGGELDGIIDFDVWLGSETEFSTAGLDTDQIDLELYIDPHIYPGYHNNHNNPEATIQWLVTLRKVTTDYANYIRTLREQNRHRDNPFAERVSVFSNVENGHGIFAGYTEEVLSFEEEKN